MPAIARRRAGASTADMQTEMTRLAAELAAANPGQGYDRLTSAVTPLIDATVGRVATALWILLGASALVLLVASSNIANLFFVRGEVKQREMALRRALGGGAGAIAGFFLSESAWLALAGGALGTLLAWGAVSGIVAFGPANLPRLQEVRFDGVIVAFAAVLSMAAGAIFGTMPILRLWAREISLHESGRANTASPRRHRTRYVLMATQTAFAVVLVVAAGLLLRSFQRVSAVDPGFDATSALTFRIGLPSSDYPDRTSMAVAYRAIVDQLSALPGVTAASAVTCLPLDQNGCLSAPLVVDGQTPPPDAQRPQVTFMAIAGGYFETMRIAVVRGRSIDRGDVEHGEPVAVVNEAFARVAFAQGDPLGRRIRVGTADSRSPGWLTIVGVVANTSFRTLTEAQAVPIIYMPIVGPRIVTPIPPLGAMSYIVRTAGRPQDMTAAVRGAVGEIDPHLALAEVATLQDVLARASAQMAFTMLLLVIAAAVALVLGVVGIYGVMSYVVSQRTGEIGVRLALGAEPGSVAGMIVRQGGIVALAGIGAGLAAALASSRLIESLLYGVSPRDPGVFAAATLLLFVVALVACWLPARRAARLNPIEALRAE
jgi:putative ABC transport system permease protein